MIDWQSKKNSLSQKKERGYFWKGSVFLQRKRKGSAVLGTMFEFIIIMGILMLTMLLWRPFLIYMNLGYYCKAATNYIEISGNASDETIAKFNNSFNSIGNSYGIKNLTLEIEPKESYFSNTNHRPNEKILQLRQTFTVTATCEQDIVLSFLGSEEGKLSVTIPYTRKMTGMSQVYTKP